MYDSNVFMSTRLVCLMWIVAMCIELFSIVYTGRCALFLMPLSHLQQSWSKRRFDFHIRYFLVFFMYNFISLFSRFAIIQFDDVADNDNGHCVIHAMMNTRQGKWCRDRASYKGKKLSTPKCMNKSKLKRNPTNDWMEMEVGESHSLAIAQAPQPSWPDSIRTISRTHIMSRQGKDTKRVYLNLLFFLGFCDFNDNRFDHALRQCIDRQRNSFSMT